MHIRNHLIATGRYLSILPGSALHFSVKRHPLKILPLDLGIKPVPTGILTLKHRTLSPVVDRFIECAREVVKSMAGRLEGRTTAAEKPDVP
jgi:DNA-binding transcriptional LysR family regulator